MNESRLALFLMLGQSADRQIAGRTDLVPSQPLRLSATFDLGEVLPDTVHTAIEAAEAYKLFFVFESYLRDLIIDVLSADASSPWWDKVPKDVQIEVETMEQTEETKSWMAIGARDRASLVTYPQLLRIIDTCWKSGFSDVIRDKSLIQEARFLTHLRNTVAHMTPVPEEEIGRIRQVMRDWFRMVAP
ncbi:MAG: Swt1 family HEPN domain-containing protein [Gemmatimonadota bacterium]|nr:Swt1 family HEPN domain-containing protein [Gemmatimonadota bacterium]